MAASLRTPWLIRCNSLRLVGRTRQRCSAYNSRTSSRPFHSSTPRDIVKPFLLADIGEGTRECQIIQWFVQPGARVEQFDKLCEVQSDKAATDITSPFDGVIKKLHYEPDDMAIVGKPLVDIDIQSDISPEDAEKLGGVGAGKADTTKQAVPSRKEEASGQKPEPPSSSRQREVRGGPQAYEERRSLATPAVRHLTKELSVNIEDIDGTGKDGRVTKEDVQRHVSQSTASEAPSSRRKDTIIPLTPVQSAMFKKMTRSLSIPHFLYTVSVDMSNLTALRQRLNKKRSQNQRLSPLPFIVKAISQAFAHHPLLNAWLDTSNLDKPELTYRSSHDFGIAVDTPSGLLVPIVRGVDTLSVAGIAASIRSLSDTAHRGKLQASDFKGATFTISNIGSIGGGVVAPVIVEPQVGILGVGRSRIVPAFDETGAVVKREELMLSWSADHRVVDGAECARAAERVRGYLEGIEEWVLEMR